VSGASLQGLGMECPNLVGHPMAELGWITAEGGEEINF